MHIWKECSVLEGGPHQGAKKSKSVIWKMLNLLWRLANISYRTSSELNCKTRGSKQGVCRDRSKHPRRLRTHLRARAVYWHEEENPEFLSEETFVDKQTSLPACEKGAGQGHREGRSGTKEGLPRTLDCSQEKQSRYQINCSKMTAADKMKASHCHPIFTEITWQEAGWLRKAEIRY